MDQLPPLHPTIPSLRLSTQTMRFSNTNLVESISTIDYTLLSPLAPYIYIQKVNKNHL